MSVAGPAQFGIVKEFFSGLIKRAKTSSAQQKYLAYGGGGNIVANLVFGGGGEKLGFIGKMGRLIDFGLDLAAIGSIFFAPLAFYAGCGYALKTAWHGLCGLWCLTQRDVGGAMANFVTAGITMASILPFHRWKGLVNKAIKVRDLKGDELADLALEPLLKKGSKSSIFETEALKALEKNKIRLNGDDIVKGECKKYGDNFVEAFTKQRNTAEEKIAVNINKVKGEGTVAVKRAEGMNPKDSLFDRKLIKGTKNDLLKQADKAKEEAEEATRLLKQKQDEIKELEAKLHRKEIEEVKVKEAKEKLTDIQKTANEKATTQKETTKKLQQFEDDAKRLEEIEGDLKTAEKRTARLQEAANLTKECETRALALNKEFSEETAQKGILDQNRSAYYLTEVAEILENHNKTLITARISPRRAVRTCVQESYGISDARTARRWYDKVLSWFKRAPKKSEVAGEAVTKEVKEKVGPLAKVFRTFRKAWDDADPNKIAKAVTNPNTPPATVSAQPPSQTVVKTRIWTPGFENPNPRVPLREVPPFITREPHLTHRQFTGEKIMPGAWVSPGTKVEINGTTIVKG